jgi:beta-1,4-mannosyl-glycoprotein beta-1,4-N-acetylglucosaminyltransferase
VTRRKIIDTFMVNAEFDMLECRLATMSSAVDWFVAVEADVDHQNHPKPYYLSDSIEFLSPWLNKMIVVKATGLPTTPHLEDPWAREVAQREWVTVGLGRIPGLTGDDIVLHGDVDEIVDPLFVRNARPKRGELVTFGQRLHCFAVDWLHPDHWWGTVAATVDTINDLGERPFKKIRNARGGVGPMSITMLDRPPDAFAHEVDPTGPRVTGRRLPNAGWHFSWMGGKDAAVAKLNSFCHPEIADRTAVKLERGLCTIEGEHVDGTRMAPVDIDDTWPRWITEGNAPASWFRPRVTP